MMTLRAILILVILALLAACEDIPGGTECALNGENDEPVNATCSLTFNW